MRSAIRRAVSEPVIREISEDGDLKSSTSLIRRSFKTVADDFGLTKENCPDHTAFLTTGSLRKQREKGLKCFGLFSGRTQIGFVGIEEYHPDQLVRLDPGEIRYWLEKLAVLPSHRHLGYGEKLVDFAVKYVVEKGGTRIALGMMNKHAVLKKWYLGLGFREKELKEFDHLPFVVCFMEKSLRPWSLK